MSPAPKFWEISQIREFSENSTENRTKFLCYFQNWSKTPQKLLNATETLKKLPKIAQNFYIFVKSAQKSSQKLPIFLKIGQNFSVFVKSTLKSSRKAPEFWRDFNLATSLHSVTLGPLGVSWTLRYLLQSCSQIEISPEFGSFSGAFLGTFDKNGKVLCHFFLIWELFGSFFWCF